MAAMDDQSLFLRLSQIVGKMPNEVADEIVRTLWSTRKTGLQSQQKSCVRDLLGLPSSEELDPASKHLPRVLACLRILIGKSVRESLSEDDIRKLFPNDFPLQLQNDLAVLLHKYWKEDVSNEQPEWKKTRVCYQVKVGSAYQPVTSSLPNIEKTQMQPCQDGVCNSLSHDHLDEPTGQENGENHPLVAPTQQVDIPHLKSMAWTIENEKSNPSTKMAIITLKLEDCTKSHSGEKVLKLKASKDTLDDMLRSMRCIIEKMDEMLV